MEKESVHAHAVPVALSVAGSDSCAGAGIQGDLKTFSAHCVYGLTAVTCAVSEVPGMVAGVEPVDPRHLRSQIALALEHYPVSVVKTGMFPTAAHVQVLVECLEALSFEGALVVDPVMSASAGDDLASQEAIAAMTGLLLPRATVVTPNLPEAERLLEREIDSKEAMEIAARDLSVRFETAIVLKGGHLSGDGDASDVFIDSPEIGADPIWIVGQRIAGRDVHGTGCAFASAVAAGIANGAPLSDAVKAAKRFVAGAIQHALEWDGVWALHHFYDQEGLGE